MIMVRLVTLWLLVLLCTVNSYAAEQDPVAMLQHKADALVDGLKKAPPSLNPRKAYTYNLAFGIISPVIAIDEMARQVLPAITWSSASQQERKTFKDEFLRLIVKTYAKSMTAYSGQVATFYPVRGGYNNQQTISVTSTVANSDGSAPIKVEYKLILLDDGWKIYDMSVAGVSVLSSFREQFTDLLGTKGHLADVISNLAQHNNIS